MTTQAIISLVKNGNTFIKIICGCDGYNAEKLVKVLKDKKLNNIKDIYIMPLESGFGCKECLVVMNSENIVFDGDEKVGPFEKRKEEHLKDGFDWNRDPFENWTKEDWDNY